MKNLAFVIHSKLQVSYLAFMLIHPGSLPASNVLVLGLNDEESESGQFSSDTVSYWTFIKVNPPSSKVESLGKYRLTITIETNGSLSAAYAGDHIPSFISNDASSIEKDGNVVITLETDGDSILNSGFLGIFAGSDNVDPIYFTVIGRLEKLSR